MRFDGQRDISVSHDKIGDVLRDASDLDAALSSYSDGRTIVEKLVERDPLDTQLQRDLSVSNAKIGNVLREQGDLEAALAAYRESLATTSALWRRTTPPTPTGSAISRSAWRKLPTSCTSKATSRARSTAMKRACLSCRGWWQAIPPMPTGNATCRSHWPRSAICA